MTNDARIPEFVKVDLEEMCRLEEAGHVRASNIEWMSEEEIIRRFRWQE